MALYMKLIGPQTNNKFINNLKPNNEPKKNAQISHYLSQDFLTQVWGKYEVGLSMVNFLITKPVRIGEDTLSLMLSES
jgi:hypothetical protein